MRRGPSVSAPSVRLVSTAFAGAMLLSACTAVNQDAINAEPLRCPVGSDCYDDVLPIGPGGSISIESFDLGFRNLTGTAVDGPNEVTIINVGEAIHNIRIDNAAGEDKKVEALGGETVTGTLQLFAGEYVYYCDIPGHRAAGMEGTLQVLDPSEVGAAPTTGATSDPQDDLVEDPDAQDADDTGGTTASPDAEDPAEDLDTDNLSEDDIEALDDSDDVAAALDTREFARLYAVTFASGSDELEDGADEVLADIVAWMEANPTRELRIEGNSDSSGGAEANQALSERRAQAVVDALIDLGADEDLLTALGNGEGNPIVEDDSDSDVAKRINRRVEVIVAR